MGPRSGAIDRCSYGLVDDPMVEVELSIEPAEVAPMAFDELRAHVKGLLGEDAKPDSVPFGDKGWAYGSKSEARLRYCGASNCIEPRCRTYGARPRLLLRSKWFDSWRR